MYISYLLNRLVTYINLFIDKQSLSCVRKDSYLDQNLELLNTLRFYDEILAQCYGKNDSLIFL